MRPLPPHPAVPQCHAWAFRVLGREPRIDPEAVRQIEECERACGRRLPATVREWYSFEGVRHALAHWRDECGPSTLRYVLQRFAARDERISVFGEWDANSG